MTNEEWFFSTRENIENNTGLSEHKQRMAINKLVEIKIIRTIIKNITHHIKEKITSQIINKENIQLNSLISFIAIKFDFL